ncbi:transposase [Streptomyces tendae]
MDTGMGHHLAAAVDKTGATLWAEKTDNDESAISTALGDLEPADEVCWAVDISGTASVPLLALMAAHGQQGGAIASKSQTGTQWFTSRRSTATGEGAPSGCGCGPSTAPGSGRSPPWWPAPTRSRTSTGPYRCGLHH